MRALLRFQTAFPQHSTAMNQTKFSGVKPMSKFDKACAIITIPAGLIMMAMGAAGFFIGSEAHFDLPPILGLVPFFIGWSMCVTLFRFWRYSLTLPEPTDVYPIPVSQFAGDPRYHSFLEEHPEFLKAPRLVRHHGFKNWLGLRLRKSQQTDPF